VGSAPGLTDCDLARTVQEAEVAAKTPEATTGWVDQYDDRHEYQAFRYASDLLQAYPKPEPS